MIDDRLVRDIEVGAKAIPRYKTEVITSDDGTEYRNSRWAYPLLSFEFNVEPGIIGEATMEAFRDLFYAAGGMAEAFLFRDWSDYAGEDQLIGTGDGSTTTFQLIKNYTRGAVTRQRKITRLIADTAVIYVNGVEQMSGVTVNEDTGLVTFSLAPGSGAEVTADFQFLLPVRFDDDSLQLLSLSRDLIQPVSVVLMQIKE